MEQEGLHKRLFPLYFYLKVRTIDGAAQVNALYLIFYNTTSSAYVVVHRYVIYRELHVGARERSAGKEELSVQVCQQRYWRISVRLIT